MTQWLTALPVVIPLLSAALALALRTRPAQARAVSIIGAVALLAASLALLQSVWTSGIHVMHVGGWDAPYGIALVVDPLSAGLVAVCSVVVLAVAAYGQRAMGQVREHLGYHALYWLLVAGVCGAFTTGDLFNLYVWFEVLVVSSFALLVVGKRRVHLPAAARYVLLNVLASLSLLSAIGLLYGLTGTLNMAELSLRIASVEDRATLDVIAMLLLFAFGTKAGLFPLFFWLPGAYSIAPSAVVALFAGLLTKVGVYALLRTLTLLFPLDHNEALRQVLLIGATVTMLAGVLGAAYQSDVRRILSFHIVSQIGYMVLGLALYTPLALLGAVFYIVHHIVVKTNLFLLGDTIAADGGTYELDSLGGLYQRQPWLALAFLVSALSLAGLPPLSGFWAKLLLIRAALDAGQHLAAAVALLVGLLTLYSMLKIWLAAFWRQQESTSRPRRSMPLAPMAGLAVVTLGLGLFAEPLAAYSERSATALLQQEVYVRAVLGDDL